MYCHVCRNFGVLFVDQETDDTVACPNCALSAHVKECGQCHGGAPLMCAEGASLLADLHEVICMRVETQRAGSAT
jgi:hypothetical protein